MRGVSVELGLGIAIAAVCVSAAGAGAWIAAGVFEEHAEAEAFSGLQLAAAAFAEQERSETDRLASALDVLLENAPLRAAFVARDRQALLAAARPLFAAMAQGGRITHWYFIEPEPARTVFLRVHRPELFGDRVERSTFQRAIDTHELAAGMELGQTAFALRVVRPWVHEGRLLGYVELAEEIDHFLAAMKSRTGDDYALLVEKRFLDEQAWARAAGMRANTWNDRPGAVVVDTTTFAEGIVADHGDPEHLPSGGRALGRVARGERAYVRGAFPLADAGGRKVGALFVLHDFTRDDAGVRAGVLRYALALLAIGAAVAGVVIAAVHLLVFARLARMRVALERRMGAARLPPRGTGGDPGDDEVGRVEALAGRILDARRGAEPPGRGGPGPGAAPRG